MIGCSFLHALKHEYITSCNPPCSSPTWYLSCTLTSLSEPQLQRLSPSARLEIILSFVQQTFLCHHYFDMTRQHLQEFKIYYCLEEVDSNGVLATQRHRATTIFPLIVECWTGFWSTPATIRHVQDATNLWQIFSAANQF